MESERETKIEGAVEKMEGEKEKRKKKMSHNRLIDFLLGPYRPKRIMDHNRRIELYWAQTRPIMVFIYWAGIIWTRWLGP